MSFINPFRLKLSNRISCTRLFIYSFFCFLCDFFFNFNYSPGRNKKYFCMVRDSWYCSGMYRIISYFYWFNHSTCDVYIGSFILDVLNTFDMKKGINLFSSLIKFFYIIFEIKPRTWHFNYIYFSKSSVSLPIIIDISIYSNPQMKENLYAFIHITEKDSFLRLLKKKFQSHFSVVTAENSDEL